MPKAKRRKDQILTRICRTLMEFAGFSPLPLPPSSELALSFALPLPFPFAPESLALPLAIAVNKSGICPMNGSAPADMTFEIRDITVEI